MKITIDTANDTKEELRKLISLLQSIVGEEKPADIFSEPESVPSDGIFNMFGEQETTPEETAEESFKLEEY